MRILIACFPKSGSTYLGYLIGGLPNFEMVPFLPAYGRREQELSESRLSALDPNRHQIAQHHVRASEYTLHLIERFELKLVVLVRNIFDCAVSLADHMVKESPVFPSAFFDERALDMPPEKRLDAVVDLALPWYIHFYVSWWSVRRDAIVTYEEIILGGSEKRREFLAGLGIDTDSKEVEAVSQQAFNQFSRFNVGRSGRGLQVLSPQTIDRVISLTRYYPHVDFEPIGIKDGLPCQAVG